MSNHWEFFPCFVSGHPASIVYDHGINELIDDINITSFLQIKMPLKKPDGKGLISESEKKVLNIIEDEIESLIQKNEGIYVGRIVTQGYYFFYSYLQKSEYEIQTIINYLKTALDYNFTYFISEDPKKEKYWEDLFPTDLDWQIIQDIKKIKKLEDKGENLEKKRRIDHFIYFDSKSNLEKFKKWALNNEFKVDNVMEPDGKVLEFSIQIFNTSVLVLDEISTYTTLVLDNALDNDGDYDGWEAEC